MHPAPSFRSTGLNSLTEQDRAPRFVLYLAIITALALGLRLYRLGFESLWMDELVTIETYHYPLVPLIEKSADLGQPPLDNLIGAVLARGGLADDDWWVRLPAALFGGASVYLLGLLVRRLHGGAAALIAALFLGVCPLHQYLSQEARPYAIFYFFALAAVLAYLSARVRNCIRAWSRYSIVLFLTLMTRWVDPHFLTLGLGLFSLTAFLGARSDPVERRRFHRAAVATIAAYAAYAPFFWIVYTHSRASVASQGADVPARMWSHVSEWYQAVFHGYSTRTLFAALPGETWILAFALALTGVGALTLIARAVRARSIQPMFALLALAPFPFIYAIVFAAMGNALPKPQYLLFGIVPLFMHVAVGVTVVAKAITRTRPLFAAPAGVVLTVLLLAPMSSTTWASLQCRDKQDWRGLMTHLRAHAGSEDAFAIIATDTVPPSFHVSAYGRSRYGPPAAKFLSISLKTDPTTLDAKTWQTSGHTLWLAGYTDRRYTGVDELPPPNVDHANVYAFEGLFLIERRGSESATVKLLDVLSEVYAGLPEGSSLVAPAIFAAKVEAARGSAQRASHWLGVAAAQCRDRVELGLLESDWITPLRATLQPPLRVEHHTRADQSPRPTQPLPHGQSLVE